MQDLIAPARSGNRAALAYLDAVGARDKLAGPGTASVPFMDLKSGERWTLHANDGAIPWWIFVPSRRVPVAVTTTPSPNCAARGSRPNSIWDGPG